MKTHSLVHAADEGDPLFTQMRETFGERVSSMDPERGPAYRLKGAYDTVFPRVLPNADVDFIAQEFGTYHAVRVLQALRAENRWHHYGDGRVDIQRSSRCGRDLRPTTSMAENRARARKNCHRPSPGFVDGGDRLSHCRNPLPSSVRRPCPRK